jgi:polyhydroxyalkanoate synthesis regulator phasin
VLSILKHVGHSRFNNYKVGENKIAKVKFKLVKAGKLNIKQALEKFVGNFLLLF